MSDDRDRDELIADIERTLRQLKELKEFVRSVAGHHPSLSLEADEVERKIEELERKLGDMRRKH